MTEDLTAAQFVERMRALQDPVELVKIQRYFKSGAGDYGEGDEFMGVRMGQMFQLAKEFINPPPAEIETLMESPIHKIRSGAMSVMAKQAGQRKTTAERRKDLYDLYPRRHDRINNWDLVDLAAGNVIGGFLVDKPRDILYDLARSTNMWERRTAIYANGAFQRRGDLDDTYAIAAILLDDPEDLLNKAVGGWLRNAGTSDRPRLLAFLDEHATWMPRTTLTYAMEHLDKDQRAHYRAL
ncbi:MAG: DNA alkylation repair protein [Actinomycetota bacterium]|nr:DNA alkylation repair protein [Actinomycetota bacterium]